jgi:hypothetical protein
MTYYGHLTEMPGSVEFYDLIHAETLRRTQGDVDGLLVHIARATPTGFDVIEVWTDRDSCLRADQQILNPIIASLAGPSSSAAGSLEPRVEEFTPRGLVLPGRRAVL